MSKSFEDVSSDGAILQAEQEMTELAVGLFDRLVAELAGYVPRDLSTDEKRHVVEGLIEANPELDEMAERLATLRLLLQE
ncbi:MAG: hypothetical protein ACOYD4_08600 [Solirubrobacterales bacterium]